MDNISENITHLEKELKLLITNTQYNINLSAIIHKINKNKQINIYDSETETEEYSVPTNDSMTISTIKLPSEYFK
jgi:hypothetical protein